MIQSFLRNNDWFKGDIIILTSKTMAYMSDTNKNLLKSLYENIKFKLVDESHYSNVISHFGTRIQPRKKVRILKFDAFSLTGYEQVLYSDSDIIYTGSVQDVFLTPNSLTISRYGFGTLKESDATIVKGTLSMSPAFFSFTSDFVMKCYKPSLIKYGEKYNLSESDVSLFDQSIMNRLFKNLVVTVLPSKYNMNSSWYYENRDCPVNDVRCIHYQDNKPWSENFNDHEGRKKSENFWFDEYNKLPDSFTKKKTDVKLPSNVKKFVSKPAPIIKEQTKINVEICKPRIEDIKSKYALCTNLTNDTKSMILDFLGKNKWFSGDIVINGEYVNKFGVKYDNIIFTDNFSGYEKIMFLDSSVKPTCNLYGLFLQNHDCVEIVKDNNDIRLKQDSDVSEPYFYFRNKNYNEKSNIVLFPESYFKK